MSKILIRFFLPILLAIFSLSTNYSCVGKKKFLAEVANRTNCDSTLQALNRHNLILNREIADLNLQLAEKKGEVKALGGIHDKQVKQIDHLESEIRRMSNASLNQQQTLDVALQARDREIAEQQATIKGFKDAILTQEQHLKDLIGKVTSNLSRYSSDDFSVEFKKGEGYIILSDNLLFKKGTTTLSKNAYDVLEAISRVLAEYPQMTATIVGHTDNQPGKTDPWQMSALRATPVVALLTKEFGLNPNQVTAAGKADAKPIATNETPKGREQNRRTEIVISPPTDKILKMVLESGN